MRVLRVAAITLLCATLADAQGPATGRPPFGSSQDGEFDSVNLYNLNVNFAIPIASVPGRGLSFSYSFVYDSSVWKKVQLTQTTWGWRPVTDASGTATWGWKRTDLVPGGITYASRQDEICSKETWHPAIQEWIIIPYYATYYYNYAYTDADGTRHPFDVAFYGSNPSYCVQQGIQIPTGPRTGSATDGSGILLNAASPTAPTVTEKFGGVSTFDTNGNLITKNTLPSSEIQWTDTLGHIVLRIVSGSDASGSYRDYFVKDTGGIERNYRERLKSISVSSAFACTGIQDYSASATVVDKIEFPTVGSFTPTYTFQYDTKGRITSVTLPTGGSYAYTYGPVVCSDGSAQSLIRTINPGGAWDYSRTLVGSIWKTTVKAPGLSYDSSVRNETLLEFTNGLETKRQSFQGPTTGTVLVTVNSTYNTIGTAAVPASRVAVLPNNLQSKVEFTFDSFVENSLTKTRGNIKELREFDFGSGAPPASFTRKTTLSYWHETNSAYASKNIVNRVSNIQVLDSSGAKKAETIVLYDETALQTAPGAPQHDYTGYPATYLTRGNPTTTKRWISGITYAISTIAYDELGNLRAATDPGTHQTTFNYTDSWGDGACPPPANTLAYPTTITNALGQSTLLEYYQCTGQVQSIRDPNDVANSRPGTVLTYADPLSRLTQTDFADTGQITIAYNDSARTLTTTQKRTSAESVSVTEQFDELGRLAQRQLPASRKVDVIYDPLGRAWKSSNPYVSATDPTYGLIENQFDALGRVKKLIRQDTTSSLLLEYSSNETRVTDESGKKRLALADGLGRAAKVCEVTAGNARSPSASCGFAGFAENGYVTTNGYDVLDNVAQIAQGAAPQQQTRTMAYDGLGRITSARILEVSTTNDVTYGYDLDSNRTSVTDPRGTVNFEYDALHRLLRKKHGTTVVAEYSYDGTAANNAIGRLITDTDGPVGTADHSDYTYDPLGRILTANRTVSSTGYNIWYQYDLMGNLTQLTYPSGRIVSYAYNTAAELTQVRDVTSTAFDYVTGASYSPLGTLQQLSLGNQVSTTLGWNNLARLTSILTQKSASPALLNLGYSYHTNGQIQQITNNLDSLKTEKYSYDELGRLLTAQRGPDTNIQRKYEYDYDRFGNRWGQNVVAGSGLAGSNSFDYASNRVTSTGFSYDNSGNLTANGAGTSYTFNPENFVTAAGASSTYSVDTLGRRTKKTVSGTTTNYFYSGSVVISEKLGSSWTDYIFFGNQRIAKQTGSTSTTATYLHADHLGSTRRCTDSSGNSNGSCDYEPFGEFQPGSACSDLPINYRFASMEHDSETGLYHTWFRQYDPNQGRWMGVDPLPGSPDDPQSLNRYAYVLNDPANLVDPLGLECWTETVWELVDVTRETAGGPVISAEWQRRRIRVCDRVQRLGPGGGSGPGAEKVVKQFSSTFQCNLDAKTLLQAVKRNFAAFANYSGALSSAVFSPGQIIQGQSVRIDTNITIFPGYAVGTTNRVNVSSVTQNSFTFTAVGGEHFMAGGSTVSFSARDAGRGTLQFAVDVNGRTANFFFTLAAELGGKSTEASVWNNFLKNLAAACKDSSAR